MTINAINIVKYKQALLNVFKLQNKICMLDLPEYKVGQRVPRPQKQLHSNMKKSTKLFKIYFAPLDDKGQLKVLATNQQNQTAMTFLNQWRGNCITYLEGRGGIKPFTPNEDLNTAPLVYKARQSPLCQHPRDSQHTKKLQ